MMMPKPKSRCRGRSGGRSPKNMAMLRRLKSDLYDSIIIRTNGKETRESSDTLGACLIKLAELATIRYLWNRSGPEGIGSREDIQDYVLEGLWKLFAKGKVDTSRFKGVASAYNYLLLAAKQLAAHYVRREMRRRSKVLFVPLSALEPRTVNAAEESDGIVFDG